MKRIVCLLLCLTLMLPFAVASAVEYTLPEKLQRQIDFGNGVKGALTVSVEGDNKWAELLAPLKDVPLQLRGIRTEGKFQYQIYAVDGENQVGLTQLYGDDQSVYLRSALLPETLLTMSTGGDIVDRLLRGDAANPSWYSAAMNMLSVSDSTWADAWEPALAPYEEQVELWLNDYAKAPSVKRDENGAGTMLVRFEIPAEAVKMETKVILEKLLQDEALLPLLRAQMTLEQQAAYLTPNLMYYYIQAIDALPLEGTVILERELTTKGVIIGSALTFPMPENESGWTELSLESADKTTTVTLTSDTGSMSLRVEKTSHTAESVRYQGVWRSTPVSSEETLASIGFVATRIHSLDVDAELRSHDITTWDIRLQPDLSHLAENDPARADYLDFDPVTLNVKLHYSSKNAQFSPTTLEASVAAAWSKGSAKLSAVIKTYSPWVLETWPTEGARDVAELSAEELTRLATDLGLNGLVALASLQPDPLPQPAEATQTDMSAASATDLT